MSDIKKLLETIDRMSTAERKSTGPQFPGYWKGTDPVSKAKDKMVGDAEESVIKDLHSTAKKKVTEWQLQEKYAKFKEQDSKAYTGIDPIVRQRMGMPPATADEIKSYVDKNPPAIKAGDGFLKGPRPEVPVTSDPDERLGVLSGGQMDVANAAIKAAGIKTVTPTPFIAPPAAPASVSAPATQAAPSPVIKPGDSTARSSTQSGSNLPGMFNPGLPNWQNSPLNPANQPKSADSTAASTSSPTASSVAQGSSALDPAKNTDKATNIPGGQSAGGPGVVPPAARSSSTSTPYRGNQGAREIQAVNPSIKDVNKIQAGQRLKLPGSDEDYIVQRGDTLDKIGKMYRSGEIGPGSQPAAPAAAAQPTAPAARPTAPAAAAQPTAPAASGPRPPIIPPGGLPTSNPPTRFDPPGPDTDTSDRPRAVSGTQTSAAPSSGPRVGRASQAPAATSSSSQSTNTVQQPAASGVRSSVNFSTNVLGSFFDFEKGADGNWYPVGAKQVPINRIRKPEMIRDLEKNVKPAALASTATQTSAPATRSVHPEGTTVKAQIRDPNDPSKPLDITLKKGADGNWYDTKGRRANFNKPGDLEKIEQLPGKQSFLDKAKRVLSGEFPSKVFGNRGQTSQPASSQPAAPAASSPQPAAPRTPSSQRSSTSSTANSSDAMASYATKGGRVYAADFNNPSGLGWDGKGKYTSYKTPEEGVNATRDLVARYLTDQTPFIKGSPTPDQVVSTWVTGGKTPADKIQGGRYLQSVNNELAAAGVKLDAKGRIPYSQAARDAITRAIIRHETAPKHMEKFAPFLNAPKDAKGSIEESNKEDEKIAGRYDPDDFDLMVKRLGQRAREQDRKHGPVDIAALAKRLRAIEKREQTKEQEDPAINTQDPDIQKTSQTSPQQDPAAVRQQQLDQTVDMATAKGTMTGLKNVLGPKVDTNALASAVTKISDGKPLSGPESMSMSALTPLISKAAETPQTAMALKTALSNAGMLSKQGK